MKVKISGNVDLTIDMEEPFVAPEPASPPPVQSATLVHHYDVGSLGGSVDETADFWADSAGNSPLEQTVDHRRPFVLDSGLSARNTWDETDGSLFTADLFDWSYAFIVYKHGDGTTTVSTSPKVLEHNSFKIEENGKVADTAAILADTVHINGEQTLVATPTGEAALLDGELTASTDRLFLLRGTQEESGHAYLENLLMVREVLLYDVRPSNGDLCRIRSHLMNKWGIR